MSILITGGAGYIGSHAIVEFLNGGYDVVVVDNLSNSKEESLNRVKKITGKDFKFYKEDVRDYEAMTRIFKENNIDSVIHFAGLKAVGESCKMPLEYYENNLGSTFTLLKVMKEHGCKKIVFSSSATVYGTPEKCPITEDMPTSKCTNPYGTTKLMQEQILQDVAAADNEFSVVLLRYFNPIGAHESGLIGEDPNGIPNNLMPYIAQVATGKLKELSVYGNDYDTVDGTGVRDYIHVVDLAKGHVKALEKINSSKPQVFIYNLGTGVGYSVLEMVESFKKVNHVDVPYKIVERRPGDIAECYADPSKALKELGWKANFGIDEMCESAYKFQKNNPQGY